VGRIEREACRLLVGGGSRFNPFAGSRSRPMNNDQRSDRWTQLKEMIGVKWGGKLTNDDLDVIAGNRERLLGKIQQRYGVVREVAERRVKEWELVNTIVWHRERETMTSDG
jgi:uncharacterized protein YjbJ (UPF0337 family)